MLAVGAAALLLLVSGRAGATSNKLTVETVSDYSGCPGWGDLNSNADGNGFLSGMESPDDSTTWTSGPHWIDWNVWDSDFIDPDRTGSYGDDTDNFDTANTGIAWYTGHGGPEGGYGNGGCGQPAEQCSTGLDCNNPPGAATYPSICKNESPTKHLCVYNIPTFIHTCNITRPNQVDISDDAAFGESPDSGGWAGFGTNGGANMVVDTASCQMEPGLYFYKLGSVFAGLHILATTMSTSGDVGIYANRGSTFAGIWAASQSSGYQQYDSPAWAWLWMAPELGGEGMSCAFGNGYGGLNGCGAYVVMARDADVTTAHWHIDSESWLDLQNDANDARGNAASYIQVFCNYDCSAHPFWLGDVNYGW